MIQPERERQNVKLRHFSARNKMNGNSMVRQELLFLMLSVAMENKAISYRHAKVNFHFSFNAADASTKVPETQ